MTGEGEGGGNVMEEESEATRRNREAFERWTQQKELRFIASLGHANEEKLKRMEGGERLAYRVRCLEGYIESLATREVFFDNVDTLSLLIAARVELANI